MTVEQQLAVLHDELRSLRRLIEERTAPAALAKDRPDDLVDVEYAAVRLGLSVRTVREGKAGTSAITRQSDRPILFFRRDIENFIRQRAEKKRAPGERALRLLDRRRSRKKSAA